MSGIVNSTGGRSGILGTTVGTPSGGNNEPYCYAYKTSGQAMTSGDNHLMAWHATVKNVPLGATTAPFDLTNDRFVPQTAGIYWVHVEVDISTGSNHDGDFKMWLNKNGSMVLHHQEGSWTHYDSCFCAGLIEMNGSTDYVDCYVNQGSGSTYDTSTGAFQTRFIAFKLGPE